MKLELLTKEEKNFMSDYCNRLAELQKKSPSEQIIYTKITLSYAILNTLYNLDLLFHPLSVAIRSTTESYIVTYKETMGLFESIIVYETTNKKPYLNNEDLDKVIEHFRKLQTTSSYDFAIRAKDL